MMETMPCLLLSLSTKAYLAALSARKASVYTTKYSIHVLRLESLAIPLTKQPLYIVPVARRSEADEIAQEVNIVKGLFTDVEVNILPESVLRPTELLLSKGEAKA